MLARRINRLIPAHIRNDILAPAVDWLGGTLVDWGNRILGEHDALVPPVRLQRTTGNGNFKAAGLEFLHYFTEFGRLSPGDDVLDIGSGVGRMAVPLLRYLNDEGSYTGLDIMRDGIDWCTRNITSVRPDFRFQAIDVYNRRYNPRGKVAAKDYKFPFDDGSFDFVIATSLFTHLLPDDYPNYLSEISRVLKPGGRSLCTWFLLNQESLKLMKSSKGSIQLCDDLDGDSGAKVWDKKMPEMAIGYPEEQVFDAYQATGLKVELPVRYGAWCGRPATVNGQDIVVAIKA